MEYKLIDRFCKEVIKKKKKKKQKINIKYILILMIIIALILILGAVFVVQSGEDLDSLVHMFSYSNKKADLKAVEDEIVALTEKK